MDSLNQEVMDMTQEFLEGYLEDTDHKCDMPILMAYVNHDGEVVMAYLNCNYGDLRRVSLATGDEATLSMIAWNKDRIEQLHEEYADSDDGAE